VGLGARTQFFRGSIPIIFRRSVRTASRLPEFIRAGRDLSMSERNDTVSNSGRSWAIVRRLVFGSLPRQFVPRQMLLFALLLGDTMRMRRAVL
jgi:hypothetical protein